MSENLPEIPYELGKTLQQKIYVSVPIPQREWERPAKPCRTFASLFPEFHFSKWKRGTLTPNERQQRKEFLQSIFAALCLNLLIIGALLTVAIDPLDFNNDAFFTATISSEENEKEEQPSDSGSAGSTQVASGNPGSADITGMSPASITSLALSTVSLQMVSQDMNAPSLMFGQSVLQSNFEAIESEALKKRQAFANLKGSNSGKGSSRGSGISQSTLKGLFPKSQLGNGAAMAVIVDMSGSMQKISHSVEAYIRDNFPQGATRHVNGCPLKGANDPFLKALTSETRKERRTDYFFICDLQDGETGEGIGRIRNCLVLGKFPKRLHVVSFNRRPGRHLAKLIEVTDGTFTYIEPTLEEEEKKK